MNPSSKLLAHYGLTYVQFEKILELQHGTCALCHSAKPTVIDHDHKTGKVRGLLCNNCNVGLGFLGDNMEGVARALLYLMRPQHD